MNQECIYKLDADEGGVFSNGVRKPLRCTVLGHVRQIRFGLSCNTLTIKGCTYEANNT